VELRSYDSITPLSTRHITPGRKTASREPHKSHKEEDRRIFVFPTTGSSNSGNGWFRGTGRVGKEFIGRKKRRKKGRKEGEKEGREEE
jgi:hypothetical protein